MELEVETCCRTRAATHSNTQPVCNKIDLDAGWLRFHRNGVRFGPGFTEGVTGPLVRAVQMYHNGDLVTARLGAARGASVHRQRQRELPELCSQAMGHGSLLHTPRASLLFVTKYFYQIRFVCYFLYLRRVVSK